MRFEVLLTQDANRDLEEIYAYIARHDAPGKAHELT
jgi:toxin ParE1/3/4